MESLRWTYNEQWSYWALMKGDVEMITLEKRPAYCDRGHWYAKPLGLPALWIDAQDGFPRYYMNLERAKAELSEWLQWKLVCEQGREPA